MKTYCWIEGGFIDQNQLNGTLRRDVIHRGVASISNKDKVISKISLKHYQWIPILILMQAVVFMGPKLLWNMLEGGRMERIIKEIGESIAVDFRRFGNNLNFLFQRCLWLILIQLRRKRKAQKL